MTLSPEVLETMRRAALDSPATFVTGTLFNGEAYVCNGDAESYDQLRRELATLLSVAQSDVRLIGSAKVGFSLNPDHLLSLFGKESDLDFVIVRSDTFDEAALELAARADEFVLAGEDEKRRLRKSKENLFHGFLRPDQLPLTCSLQRDWFPKLAGPYGHPVARQYPVKAWLFKSLQHATMTYTAHQRRIQPAVLNILTQRGDL